MHKINAFEDLGEIVIFMIERETYIKLIDSGNPPSDPDALGCIGSYEYSKDFHELDGGELDYYESNNFKTIKDAIPYVLEEAGYNGESYRVVKGTELEEFENYI